MGTVLDKTVIARAPMRISFAGGGTDLPSYYNRYPGMVLSATIDKYVYSMVTPSAKTQITSAGYGGQQNDKMFWGKDLALPKAVLEFMEESEPLDILIASSVPPGTGLGSSSAVAVAMLAALCSRRGLSCHPGILARFACQVEIDMMSMPIGKQDQYASAYGGLNQICFYPDCVEVQPLHLKPKTLALLEKRLMLFYTGRARASSSILTQQNKDTGQARHNVIEALYNLREVAAYMTRVLQMDRLDTFGSYLGAAWIYKKRLSRKISSPAIDRAYRAACKAGALGGKISGAGGGGFLLLYARERHQNTITEKLENMGLSRLWFNFALQGAEVLSR